MTPPNHSDRGHHPQGPSQLKALQQCPGFENRPGTSAAAEMGTRIQEALEVRDPSHLESELEAELYDKCIAAEDVLIPEFFGDEEYNRYNELPLTIELNSGREIWGTGDVTCVSKDGSKGLQIDYKSGRMKVDDAENNLQARGYKNGAYGKFPKLETLRFIFLAPQIDWVNWYDFPPETVDLDRQVITQIVSRAEKVREDWAQGVVQPSDLNPCEQCTWCRHQTYCPAINGVLLDFAESARVSVPDGLDMGNLDDPDNVAELYGIAKILEPLIDKIKKRAVGLANEGEVLPGWELRPMGAKRIATDNQKFYDYVGTYGVTLEDVINNVNIPVAKLRDIVRDRAPKGSKAKAAKEFEQTALDMGVIKMGTERFTLRPETAED